MVGGGDRIYTDGRPWSWSRSWSWSCSQADQLVASSGDGGEYAIRIQQDALFQIRRKGNKVMEVMDDEMKESDRTTLEEREKGIKEGRTRTKGKIGSGEFGCVLSWCVPCVNEIPHLLTSKYSVLSTTSALMATLPYQVGRQASRWTLMEGKTTHSAKVRQGNKIGLIGEVASLQCQSVAVSGTAQEAEGSLSRPGIHVSRRDRPV